MRASLIHSFCRRLTDHPAFHAATMALILFTGALLGVETSSVVMQRWGGALHGLNVAIQALFVLEILVRIGAAGPRYASFFRNGWNVFDFSIVALSLLPAVGVLAAVARLARILRVVRLVSWSADLRLIVGTMIRSIPSMGHIMLLVSLLIYVYSVVGFHLFASLDPDRWGTLGRCARSLFQVLTLEGWADLQEVLLPQMPYAWMYFTSFIVIGTFVVVNLFIAVVISNLETVRQEADPRHKTLSPQELREILARLEKKIDDRR